MLSILFWFNFLDYFTYFQVLDKICLRPLGTDVLNFKSDKAYKVFIGCSDNHKAWQVLEVFLHGTTLELIDVFVKEKGIANLNALEFLKWQKKVKSATLKMMIQFVLKYALGIYVQRVGDRNNDHGISDAGRYAFLEFFYGFNHPLYQEIEYRDLRNKARYPKEIRIQRQANLTFSSSSKEASRCQGGDFLLEEKVCFSKIVWTMTQMNWPKHDKKLLD